MDTETFTSVIRMSKDIRKASETLSDQEARFLVDAYYQMQEDRIRADHRSRQMDESKEPNLVIGWLSDQSSTLEYQIKGALDRYTKAKPIGKYLRAIKGIGPVISAGYIANIDITKANTAGKIWKYCGLAPGFDRRKRGEKMVYNPSLKRLSFLCGESFKRLTPIDENAYYRHFYDKRKAYETAKNEAGDYAEQATASLAEKRFGRDTEAFKMYSQGKLPLARIDRRACRWVVKLFLSDLQRAWYELETGTEPPMPFVISVLGHGDFIDAPHVRDFLQKMREERKT